MNTQACVSVESLSLLNDVEVIEGTSAPSVALASMD